MASSFPLLLPLYNSSSFSIPPLPAPFLLRRTFFDKTILHFFFFYSTTVYLSSLIFLWTLVELILLSLFSFVSLVSFSYFQSFFISFSFSSPSSPCCSSYYYYIDINTSSFIHYPSKSSTHLLITSSDFFPTPSKYTISLFLIFFFAFLFLNL